MSGSWYESIGSGLSNLWNSAGAGASAAGDRIANSPVGVGAQNAYNNTDFGKATGLAPFMKMLGIGPSTPATTPEDRMATPLELADAQAGHLPTAGGSTYYGNQVSGLKESKSQNYFGKQVTNADGTKTTQGGFNLPSVQNWDATGRSYGNRQSDIDARVGPDGKAVKPITVGAPEVYQPDLSKIPRKVEGQTTDVVGAGRFSEHAYGEHLDWNDPGKTGWSGKTKFNPGTGKGSTTIYSTGYQAGVEEKEGWRAVAFNDDKRYSASAEAGAVANAGLSGSVGLDTKQGLYATGGIGAKAGLYAQGDANAKTKSVKIGGQDYNAGIGVHGDTFVGAKAGASGTLGLGPEFIGAKGNIGAFVGAEAAGDIHGNLGPLGGKVGASGMVGAGLGADGDISYKDGKFHIGGKLFACLGYGGSLSGDMTVDVGAIGKSLYGLGSDVVSGAGDAANYVGAGLANAGGAVLDAGGAVVDGIGDAASTVGNGIYNAGGAVVDGVGDAIGNVFSW